MKTLEEIIARIKEINSEMNKDGVDLKALNTELDTLIERKKELEAEIARKEMAERINGIIETPKSITESDDMIERKAFMEYVKTGRIGEGLIKRADTTGAASDLGVTIPMTVQRQIITEIDKISGTLYSKVKKTNLPGGVKYPLGSFSATFSRITESTKSDRQKGGAVTGFVEFSYYIGEIRLARTLLQMVLSVPEFEAEVAKTIAEAFVKAMDDEILNGKKADNQMEGILTNAKVKAIELTEADLADWKTLFTKVEASLPLSVRNKSFEYAMANTTFQTHYMTLANDNNTPIGKFVSDGGAINATINGRPVTLTETEVFPDFDTAATGKVFGMIWIPSEAYAINSNMNFSVVKYMDHELNQEVTKALVINDGKVLRPDYIYLLKKKVVTTTPAGQGGTQGG